MSVNIVIDLTDYEVAICQAQSQAAKDDLAGFVAARLRADVLPAFAAGVAGASAGLSAKFLAAPADVQAAVLETLRPFAPVA